MTSSKSSKKPNENSSKTQIDLLIRESIQQLEAAGVDAPRTDVLAMLESILGKDRTWILAYSDESLTNAQLELYNSRFRRRLNREPLAYVLGSKEFYGLNFTVNEDVLIPRPETEAMVEWIVAHAPQKSAMIDAGTGSGCIAVAVKYNRPDMKLVASDVSIQALETAQNNSSQHKTNIKFVHSDMLNYITDSFDIIAANLPYVPTAMRLERELDHEPTLALHSGADGLDHYRDFFAHARKRLNSQGKIIIEHDPMQLTELTKLAHIEGLSGQSLSDFVTVLS